MVSGGKSKKGKEVMKSDKGKMVVEVELPTGEVKDLELDELLKQAAGSSHLIVEGLKDLDPCEQVEISKYMQSHGFSIMTEREQKIEEMLQMREEQVRKLNESVKELRKTIDGIEERLKNKKKM